MQDAECHHERGTWKKQTNVLFCFYLKIAAIFDMVYVEEDQRDQINTNISAVWPLSDTWCSIITPLNNLLLYLSELKGSQTQTTLNDTHNSVL